MASRTPPEDETKLERKAREAREEQESRERHALQAFWGTLAAGVVTIIVYATFGDERFNARILTVGLLAGGASALVGALLGFLFGLPRGSGAPGDAGVAPVAPPESAGDGGAAPAAKTPAQPRPGTRPHFVVNNNLLEISDWLTKIIVGAGLVGLTDLVRWVGMVGERVGKGAGLMDAAPAIAQGAAAVAPRAAAATSDTAAMFGGSVLVFFFAWGFLFVYIQTRTIISFIFASMERSLNDFDAVVRSAVAESVQPQMDRVSDAVRSAVATEVRDTVKPQIDRVSENAILQLLYRGEAGAAQAAVDAAHAFLSQSGNENNGRVWLYLACANGQLHAVAKPTDREALALAAVEALRRALTLDPQLLGLARGLMYQDDPQHLPGDDDLASFRDDPRFQALAGPPPARSRAITAADS